MGKQTRELQGGGQLARKEGFNEVLIFFVISLGCELTAQPCIANEVAYSHAFVGRIDLGPPYA